MNDIPVIHVDFGEINLEWNTYYNIEYEEYRIFVDSLYINKKVKKVKKVNWKQGL